MYTKRQEAWVNKPAVPSLIDADVANWWEAGIYGAHQGLAALAVRAADYGVVGDGVADDTTAFTAALAAAASGSRALHIGATTVKLMTPVTVPAGVSTVGHPEGIITVGSTPGTLTMQWAQGTAEASNATLSAGSWIEIVRVA